MVIARHCESILFIRWWKMSWIGGIYLSAIWMGTARSGTHWMNSKAPQKIGLHNNGCISKKLSTSKLLAKATSANCKGVGKWPVNAWGITQVLNRRYSEPPGVDASSDSSRSWRWRMMPTSSLNFSTVVPKFEIGLRNNCSTSRRRWLQQTGNRWWLWCHVELDVELQDMESSSFMMGFCLWMGA